MGAFGGCGYSGLGGVFVRTAGIAAHSLYFALSDGGNLICQYYFKKRISVGVISDNAASLIKQGFH